MATQDLTLKMWLMQEHECGEIPGGDAVCFSKRGWYRPHEARAESVEDIIVPNHIEHIRLQLVRPTKIEDVGEKVLEYFLRAGFQLLNFTASKALIAVLVREGEGHIFERKATGGIFSVSATFEFENILNVLIIASDGETNCCNLQVLHDQP